jgi:Protein of unknown function (DUF3828)
MKQRIYFLKPLTIAAFLLPIPAYAGCTDYSNSPAQERPRAILCYKGKCDDTTVDTVCGNSSRINFQYANGLAVYRAEGKNLAPEFSNTLGRKMNAQDWTCKAVGKTGGIDACLLFQTASTAPAGTASPGKPALVPNDPAAIVSTAIKLDRQNTPLFDDGPKGRMTEFFTKGFIADWKAAAEKNKDQPWMDGDPISGFQGMESLTLKNLKVKLASDIEAKIAATLSVQSQRSGDENITFNLKREGGAWKIDDIGNPVEASLHAYLVKSSR